MNPKPASSSSPEAPISFVDLKAQQALLRSDIDARIARVLDHGRYIMGPEVSELEEALAKRTNTRYVIGCSSGTDALLIALMANGVGRGDAVFVPAFTFTASAEVILLLGATPVFIEVQSGNFNIDCTHLEQKISDVRKAGKLTPRAVMAVDLFGLPADYTRLREITEREGMLLLGDAAQSFGGSMHDMPVGNLADITATSFFPAKPLGCYGDGGAVFTNDDDQAAIIRSILAHGKGAAKYDVVRVGINGRLDTMQAAILLSKLTIFDKELIAREELASYYDARLADVVETPQRLNGRHSAWAQYTICVDNRDDVAANLKDKGIPTAVYYPLPMHLQTAYAAYGDGIGSLPVSEDLCHRVLSLPMHPYMDAATRERVCDAIHACL